ncbi:hypothetical protein J8TS2_28010 [Lederbergia ruris]|uniref:HTH cro/C1-type domain-containing protein n=1 Tax=Lederbergia ruris TaxID=217495 RepID=A0ABQ4KKJ8_9BACI|nr:helix-turn-helix domain-containing protein [Lederbergia ruris]GIN58482.1 hypothetical protein J8TS2_28010 [Lederbergia ruris]
MIDHKIKLVLKDTLDRHGISMNKLAQTGNVRYPTIHEMCNHKDKVKQVNFSTLTKIVDALRELTGDDSINVTDVFVYDDIED